MTGARTTATRPFVAVAVAAALLVASHSAPASAEHIKLTLNPASEVATFEYYGDCTVSAVVETREITDSGISRFAVEFQLRGPNDPYIPGLAHRRMGWWISDELPLDGRTFYWQVLLPPSYIVFEANSEYALWAKAVGERDSFWRRDLVQKLKLGTAGCNAFDPTEHNVPSSIADLLLVLNYQQRLAPIGGG